MLSSRFQAMLLRGQIPTEGPTRWVAASKCAVVDAVKAGTLKVDELPQRFGISVDEFLGWKRRYDRFGFNGLKAGRVQAYRVSPA